MLKQLLELTIIKVISAIALLSVAIVVWFKLSLMVGTYVLRNSYATNFDSHALAASISIALGVWFFGAFSSVGCFWFYVYDITINPPHTRFFHSKN